MPGETPEKFGKCRVSRVLGEGATANVYLGRHEVLDIPVAIKVLRKRLSERKPEYAERFLREARMAARLEHPNIVRVIDCGVEDGQHYMVMDYVDGPNVLEMIRQSEGGLEWEQALDIVRQAAEGLAYAAEQNVIHRDVKPSNLMIDSTGRVRVTDLGLAKLTIKGLVSLTQEMRTVGTPNYMSPEQIRSPGQMDLRTDIYSLGASLYHMLCSRPPYAGRTSMAVVAQHLSAPLKPPIERKPDLPPALSSIVCKMMAKAPAERYQDYDELRADLDAVRQGDKVAAEGFEETESGFEDEEELRRLLDELNFGSRIIIDDAEADREALDGEAAPTQERSSAELDPFAPDEFAASPDREAPAPGDTTALAMQMFRPPGESKTALIVSLVIVILIAIAVTAVLVLLVLE